MRTLASIKKQVPVQQILFFFAVVMLLSPAIAWSAADTGFGDSPACPNIKLNQPVPADGRIVGFGIVPDGGERVSFLGDLETDGLFDLFTVPASGGQAPIRFDIDTPRAQGLTGLPIFSPDGSRAVFRGEFDTEGVRELYSVETTDGGGTAIKLNGPLIGDVQREFVITPDGTQVVYLAEELSNLEELYVVPLLGGTSRRINNPLKSSDVRDDFQISPDGSFVVYRSRNGSFRTELFSAPLAGGPPVLLNDPLQELGGVLQFQISPDGSTVVYRSDQEVDNRFDLYQVPIGGGTVERITGSEVEEGVDDVFGISPDSTHVVYLNPRFVEGDFGIDIYAVDLVGGTPVRLNDPLPAGGFVSDFSIDPSSATVVFEGNAETNQFLEIFKVSITGGSVTKLSGDLSAADGTLGFSISPDGTTVVFGVDRDPGTGAVIQELLAVPLTGGPVRSLAGPLLPNRRVEQIDYSPDGQSLVYAAETDQDRLELFAVPLDASASPRRINQTLPAGASVEEGFGPVFQFSDDDRYVLFLADQETVGVTELWSVELACAAAIDRIFGDGFEETSIF